MRTITRTYDLFQLAELSAAARDTAYNEWLRTFEYGWDSDNRNTLEAFESVFKVKVNDCDDMEYQCSEESFEESCAANDYEFLGNGKMYN